MSQVCLSSDYRMRLTRMHLEPAVFPAFGEIFSLHRLKNSCIWLLELLQTSKLVRVVAPSLALPCKHALKVATKWKLVPSRGTI